MRKTQAFTSKVTLNKILLTMGMLQLCSFICASPQLHTRSARIDVSAKDKRNFITPLSATENGQMGHFIWKKNGGKNSLRTLFPASTKWQEASFTFKPLVDGKGVLVLRGPHVKLGNGLKRIEVDYQKVTIDGNTLLQTKPDKPLTVWHNSPKYYNIDLKQGVPVTVTVKFKLKHDPNRFKASKKATLLDLRKHANMGFKDDVAGDGKGGWSDQGPENDLKHFDIKQNLFGMIPFKIIDPKTNNGKSILTFSGKNISPLVSLKKAEIKVPAKQNQAGYYYLYLLHTTCWNTDKEGQPIGKIKIETNGGDISEFTVRNKVDVCDWWMPLPVENGAVVYEYRKNPTAGGAVGLYLSRFVISEIPQQVKKVTLETTGNAIWIVLGATLSNKHINLKKNMTPVTIRANKQWRPVQFGNYQIKKGSALDFSSLVPTGSVEQKGRVVIRGRHFENKNQPGIPIRFSGCSMGGSDLKACQTKQDIKTYVKQIKRHGFSMVRPHFLDFFLMEGSKADFDFNEKHLDQFDYMIKCMKDEGLYLYFDCITGWSGYKKGSGWGTQGKIDLKGDMLWDNQAFEHWLTGVKKLLTHYNPYTQTSLATDPVMAASVFFNEQELWNKDQYTKPAFKKLWSNWLKQKYSTMAELRKAWTTSSGHCWLSTNLNDFSQVPFVLYGISPQAADANTFLLERLDFIDNWFVKEFSKMGSKAAVSNWDCKKSIIYTAARTNMNSVSMHAYHAHPSKWVQPKSMQTQTSSIKNISPGHYFSAMALTRFLDRPFLITEYLHCFWNPYRFEEGLLMGAGAAWQDMDCLIAHAKPVRSTADSKPIHTFYTYNDPIQRASEVVAKLLFIRRDLQPAAKNVELVINMEKVLKSGYAQSALNIELEKLAFMTGVGVKVKKAKLPTGTTPFNADLELENDIIPAPKKEQLWSTLLPKLKKSGVLSSNNLSNPLTGYLESNNQAIKLDSKEGTFKVITTRLEGVSFIQPAKNLCLQNMTINSCSEPAAITTASLDLKPIPSSNNLLLVCATNALNSNMEFYGKDRRFLKSLGKAPVLLKSTKLDISVKNSAKSVTCYSLAFNGKRQETIPVTVTNGELQLVIDTSMLKVPTVFFELVLE